MPLTKLKALDQDIWLRNGGGPSADGVCYDMCSFIESANGPWSAPGTYANACTAGANFAQGTAMVNFAKALNLRKIDQRNYRALTTALAFNRLYRVGVYIGAPKSPAPAANHEFILVTGATAAEVVFFDPNNGFFTASNDGMNNRQAVEFHFNALYQPKNWVATSFNYADVRAITAKTPLGYDNSRAAAVAGAEA